MWLDAPTFYNDVCTPTEETNLVQRNNITKLTLNFHKNNQVVQNNI